MPTVELTFSALPEHVRTARLVAVSLARRAGVADEILDEVRLAVGEAATRAVGRHRACCPDEPVLVRLTDSGHRFTAEVVDVADDTLAEPPDAVLASLAHHAGPGSGTDDAAADDDLPPGVDLAVIGGLVEDLAVSIGPSGSAVLMGWPARSHG